MQAGSIVPRRRALRDGLRWLAGALLALQAQAAAALERPDLSFSASVDAFGGSYRTLDEAPFNPGNLIALLPSSRLDLVFKGSIAARLGDLHMRVDPRLAASTARFNGQHDDEARGYLQSLSLARRLGEGWTLSFDRNLLLWGPSETQPALRALHWVCVDALDDAPLPDAVARDGDDVAMLQFTSGSTGMPKGVALSHRNLLRNAHYFDLSFRHDADARVLTWLPPFHDLGLIYGMLTPVLCGVPACVLPRSLFAQRPARWIEALSRFRITHTAGPDFAYRLAAAGIAPEQVGTLDLSALLCAVNGAEPVRMRTLQEFAAKFAPAGLRRRALCPGWGLAEAACIVTAAHTGATGHAIEQRPDVLEVFVDAAALARRQLRFVDRDAPGARGFVSNGPATGSTVLRIVDPETHTECGPEAIGEIWVHNDCVSRGYWNQPEATAACFGARLAGDPRGLPYLRTALPPRTHRARHRHRRHGRPLPGRRRRGRAVAQRAGRQGRAAALHARGGEGLDPGRRRAQHPLARGGARQRQLGARGLPHGRHRQVRCRLLRLHAGRGRAAGPAAAAVPGVVLGGAGGRRLRARCLPRGGRGVRRRRAQPLLPQEHLLAPGHHLLDA